MDKCEKYIRCWQTPPETLFEEWAEWCVAEEIDPTKRLDYLRRPLKNRLKELIGEEPRGWDGDPKAPKDRILYRFYCWDVFDGRETNHSTAELVTYLEDIQEEFWRRQARRSKWRVAESERAEVVVAALLTALKEFRLYFMELTGVEPESDPRLASVLTLLLKAERRLKTHQKPPMPRSDPERRPTVGPEKNWATKVQREVLRRLNMIRPWRKHVDDSQTEHLRMLRRTSERIVERLGIRVSRGIGSAKPQPPKPPSNPGDDIARRICHALGVRRLTRTRR